MIDRLREFLERPLDPSAGRAVLVLAAAIFLGFVFLVVLAQAGQPAHSVQRPETDLAGARTLSIPPPRPAKDRRTPEREETSQFSSPSQQRQDPQDQRGSAAAGRAAEAIRAHRALQHLPYRDGTLKVSLVGAHGSRAVVRVTAPTARAARFGWRRFLRRYRDGGAGYLPLFDGRSGGSHG